MTLNDLASKLATIENAILAGLPRIAKETAMNAKALSERNAKEVGFGENYSDQEIPVFWFKGKELNGSGRKYLEDRGVKYDEAPAPAGEDGKPKKKRAKKGDAIKKNGLGNWKGFRQAQGLQTAHVDATYSGQTWASMQAAEAELKGFKAVSVIHGDAEGQQKMNYLFAMYGGFVTRALTDKDKEILASLATDDMMQIIILNFK